MRLKILDDIQNIIEQGKNWVQLELDYAILTMLIIGFLCALLGFLTLILFSFALVHVFTLIMCPALAYLTVGGIVLLCLVLIWVLRKPLLLNPLAKMLTRVLITPDVTENNH